MLNYVKYQKQKTMLNYVNVGLLEIMLNAKKCYFATNQKILENITKSTHIRNSDFAIKPEKYQKILENQDILENQHIPQSIRK